MTLCDFFAITNLYGTVFLKLCIRFYSHEDTESQEEFNIADALNSHVPEMAVRACSTTTMDSDNADEVLKLYLSNVCRVVDSIHDIL